MGPVTPWRALQELKKPLKALKKNCTYVAVSRTVLIMLNVSAWIRMYPPLFLVSLSDQQDPCFLWGPLDLARPVRIKQTFLPIQQDCSFISHSPLFLALHAHLANPT